MSNTEDQTILIDRITQRDAAHVLFVMGIEGGVTPGGFTEKLIETMLLADTQNAHRLRAAFTGLMSAVDVYKRMNGGVKILQEIAAGRPFMPGQA
jgi:hypothetical protein